MGVLAVFLPGTVITQAAEEILTLISKASS
jgi:methylmalonyl-CoA mutase cobalamin-binding subunit